MLLNRRTMLSASLGAIALSLSGCKSTKTTIVFVNNSGFPIKVSASAGGKNFNRTVSTGHTAKQVYRSNDTLGTVIPLTGTVTVVTKPATAPVPIASDVTLGYTNTYTVDAMGVVTVVVS